MSKDMDVLMAKIKNIMKSYRKIMHDSGNGTRHLAILIIVACLFQNCGCTWNVPSSVCHLTVQAENGNVSIEPDQPLYRRGDRVTLRAEAEAGYDFSAWDGDDAGMENPMTVTMTGNKIITAHFTTYELAVYYVDYDGGDDRNDGLAAGTAWKHAPGDPEATDRAAVLEVKPGHTFIFKGGTVYRGSISVPAHGSLNHHVAYRGDAWPGLAGEKTVLDGGDVISGWTQCQSSDECGGNPNFGNIFYARIPADVDSLSINLHEYASVTGTDDFLWPSQEPDAADPYFFEDRSVFITVPQSRLTRTSLRDTDIFSQVDSSFWDGSYLLIWVNPNIVSLRKIAAFNPAVDTVYFEDLGENAIYPDGRDQSYAVFNSIHAIDTPGEYYVTTVPDADNRYTVFLWPRSTVDINSRITYSVRTGGIDLGSRSNVTIEGFIVRKYAGAGLRDGVGIGTVEAAHLVNYNLVVRSNVVTHNRKGGNSMGYGGIFLQNCVNALVEDNLVEQNPRHAGIFFSGGRNIAAKNNTIIRSGSTSLRLYGVDRGILTDNVIRESNGSHANGITIYIGSKNVLVAGNLVTDSGSPVTFQDSGNLWFVNNIFDGSDGESNVNEWGDTGHGPWERGIIGFFNNTIVRNNRNASLNIGTVSGENTYIVMNNIIDGGASASSIARSHNLYTGLSWNQNAYYDWYPADGEFSEEDMSLIFNDAAAGDFILTEDSPARGAGVDIIQYMPADLFPEYDFYTDMEGNPRTIWDLGALSYIP